MQGPEPWQKAIPDKLYFRIGEVAAIAGVPSYVLRFWESEFPAIRPKRTQAGQRRYRKADVELILTIKHLLHEKRFTIQGARQRLRGHSDPEPAADRPQGLLSEIQEELRHIRELIDTLS
jgi:DNA-binding transcriptional MerR regulator